MGNGEGGMGKWDGRGDGEFFDLEGTEGGSGDVSETPEMAPDAGAGVCLDCCVCVPLCVWEKMVVVVVWKNRCGFCKRG